MAIKFIRPSSCPMRLNEKGFPDSSGIKIYQNSIDSVKFCQQVTELQIKCLGQTEGKVKDSIFRGNV